MLRTSTLLLALAGATWAADVVPAPAAETQAPEAKAPETMPAPAVSSETVLQQASYLIGRQMAGAVKEYNLDLPRVLAGLQEAASGKPSAIAKADEQAIFGKFQAEIDAAKAKVAEGRKGGNAAWMAENAKKPGIKITASGLQYEVVAATTNKDAKQPTAADTVKVNYVGALTDGTVFDASANHGGPASFGVGQVIKGWTEALQLMHEGDKYKLYIPAELAYGEQAPPSIGPNQILVFDVELVEVSGK